MKIKSKILIGGVRTVPVDRRSGRSSRNGSGTRLLELGHTLHPTAMRTTEFAPALPPEEPASRQSPAPTTSYGPPTFASTWKLGHLQGQDFVLQPDGTLRCPPDHPLSPQERRPERDGTLRVVYAARIGDCRPCPLRQQCQWHGTLSLIHISEPTRLGMISYAVFC